MKLVVPGIRPVVTSLVKDAVSDPVRLDDGWHVVKLLDLRPASVRPLDEVRDAVVSQLRVERARANRQAYLTRLLDQNPPVVADGHWSGSTFVSNQILIKHGSTYDPKKDVKGAKVVCPKDPFGRP